MARRGLPPGLQKPTQALETSGKSYPSRNDLGEDLVGITAPDGEVSKQFIRSYFGANMGSQKSEFLAAGYGDDEQLLRSMGGAGAAGTYFNPTQRSEVDLNYGQGAAGEELLPDSIENFFAAPLSEVPTSSTNYSRPRTVAAGYDPERQTMTVVFRDGTFYNYYEVTAGEWESFHASFSKGSPWLNRGFPNGRQTQDGLFINKPRGYADVSQIDAKIVEQLYRVSRAQQISKKPKSRKGKYGPGATLASQPGLRKGRGSDYRSGRTRDFPL